MVSYRLREARLARGWTQDEAGERLAPYLGVRWSAASFSAAERAVDGVRPRQFSADDLLAFARGFELPVAMFLVPPPGVRVAGPDARADGLDTAVVLDAVIGTAQSFPLFEQALLASSAEHGRGAGGPGQLPSWLGASVRAAAQRVFGSTGECIDALTKAAALLRELDGSAGGARPRAGSGRAAPAPAMPANGDRAGAPRAQVDGVIVGNGRGSDA